MAEILFGLLGPVIELGKCIAAPIKRQFNYLCCYNSNIQSLKDEAEKLDQEKTTLQRQVEEADNNAREIAPGAKIWMDETKKIQAKKREIESAIPNVPKGCLSIIHRFPLSKESKITAEAMKDLSDRRSHIDPIFLPRSAPASQLPFSSEQPHKLQSRKQIEEKVMKKLRDQKVNMVGICGIGGIGKTTMAKELWQRVMKEKLFEETVFVVASRQADISRIQREIGEQLGCYDVKKSESFEVRKNLLSARLSSTKGVLIILDDIWEKLKLEDLGIPSGKESRGCTVLLTSRAADVLMEMNVEVVPLEFLSESEAWSLFKEKAEICEDDHNLLRIAEEVANECKGLPVSIVTVGSALKGQELPIWIDALDRLKSSDPSNMPPYIEKEVYIPLRFSFEFLKDREAESLFLLCCIFPEDFEIELEDLAFYSMGLKMFGGISNMEQARNRVFTVVKKLKSRFLLLDGYNEKHVKMHDVIREVAISIAKEKRLVDDAKSEYRDSKWLFLDAMESESFGHLVGSKFPSLKLLIIFGHGSDRSTTTDINDLTFLEGMQGLNVLSFKHISFQSVPQSIELLKDLRTLQLVECRLNTLSFVGELLRLEVFQCYSCYNSEELLLEIGRPKCLKFLDISRTRLQNMPYGVISNLVELEELKMVGSFHGWESTKVKDGGRRNSSLKELEVLRKLTCLEIEIKDINLVQENITLPPKIEKYTICIGGGWYGREYDKVLVLRGIPGESNFGNWIHKLAGTTEGLYLDGEGSRNLDLSQSHHTLKELRIANCGMLKEVVDTSSISINSRGSEVFPMLEKLKLNNLSDVEKICDGPNQQVSLCNLSEVEIDGCPKLQNLFLLERAEGVLLPQLQKLHVQDCEMIEQVFILNESEDRNGNTSRAAVTFPKLTVIEFLSLPSLVTFGKRIESMELPSLEKLEVSGCEQLKSLTFPHWESEHHHDGENDNCLHLICNHKIKLRGLKGVTLRYYDVSNVWCHQIPMPLFRRLERLHIANCSNITSLLSFEMAKNLVELNYLQVYNCDRIEQVLRKEEKEDDGTTSGITFPKLKTFKLNGLPSLISLGKLVFESIEFPQLERLDIHRCPKLRTSIVSVKENNRKWEDEFSDDDEEQLMPLFCDKKVKFSKLKTLWIKGCHSILGLFSSSVAANLTSLKRLQIEDCEHMKKFVTGVAVKEMHVNSLFPSLKELTIENMPSLEIFCEWKDAFKLPVLERTRIFGCPQLKFPQVPTAPSYSHSKFIMALKLPDLPIPSKVVRLLYTNSGAAVVALDSNVVHHFWTWPHNHQNPFGQSSTFVIPQLYALQSGGFQHIKAERIKDYVACIALSKDDSYVISTSGGPYISHLETMTFKVNMERRVGDNSTLTYLALLSQDDAYFNSGDVLAIGKEDSTIAIDKLEGVELKGDHQKQISGLAFSQKLNILVSSSADAHLCVWSIGDGWEQKKSRLLQPPPNHPSPLDGDTRVQFHNDQSHLLVVHQTQIAIYDAQLECLRSWYPTDSLSSPVSCATFSCDGQRIFTGFYDGAVGVFDFEFLTLHLWIAPSEYVPSDIPSSSNGFPMVIDIAAHPFDPNQFALTNGAVYIIELDDAQITVAYVIESEDAEIKSRY